MTPKRKKIYMATHHEVVRRFGALSTVTGGGWAANLAHWLSRVTDDPPNVSRVSAWGNKCLCTDKEGVIAASKAAGLDPPIELEDFFPKTLRTPRR